MYIPLGSSLKYAGLVILALFDFDLKYRAEKSNQGVDALSQWPNNPESSSESSEDKEEWETITYSMVCQIFDYQLDSTKLPYHVKHDSSDKYSRCQKG